jgi:hypothetical protein
MIFVQPDQRKRRHQPAQSAEKCAGSAPSLGVTTCAGKCPRVYYFPIVAFAAAPTDSREHSQTSFFIWKSLSEVFQRLSGIFFFRWIHFLNLPKILYSYLFNVKSAEKVQFGELNVRGFKGGQFRTGLGVLLFQEMSDKRN